MPLTFDELVKLPVWPELIRIFGNPAMAQATSASAYGRELLRQFGLNEALWPAAPNADAFWRGVCNLISDGQAGKGLEELLRGAAGMFPGNKKFDPWRGGWDNRNLTILFLAAQPFNQPQIGAGREHQAIQDCTKGIRGILLRQRLAAGPGDIIPAMIEARPRIVHFCGHGFTKGGLVVEDPAGESTSILADWLCEALKLYNKGKPDPVRCVVLTSCFSVSAARKLASVVDVTVGCRRQVEEGAAVLFTQGFYTDIANGGDVASIFNGGVAQVAMSGLPTKKFARFPEADADCDRLVLFSP